jgi:NAD(P)-dependent dehydrogenase (short-subunit alcohol dehydrogenase family)
MTLTGKVALVAGATRGAGRGIAVELLIGRLSFSENEV